MASHLHAITTNKLKIHVKNDSHWTMLCKLWSQNEINVFESLLRRKCIPSLMIVGHTDNLKWSLIHVLWFTKEMIVT